MSLPFTKMQAVGNDFVVVEEAAWPADTKWEQEAIRLCDRKFGVGSDGLLLVGPSAVADVRMRMFNPDGTEDMCGNGLRCVIRFAYEHHLIDNLIRIPEPHDSWPASLSGVAETLDGLHRFSLMLEQWGNEDTLAVMTEHSKRVGGIAHFDPKSLGELATALQSSVPGGRYADLDNTIELKPPKFAPAELPMMVSPEWERVLNYPLVVEGYGTVPVSTINTGSTHTVIWTDTLPDDGMFFDLSPRIEHHPLYPDRTTVLWATEPKSDEEGYPRIQVRIWERGVGETLGCGTGSCAVAVAAWEQNVVPSDRRRIQIQSRGGVLGVFWRGGVNEPVSLDGPAFIVYEGNVPAR